MLRGFCSLKLSGLGFPDGGCSERLRRTCRRYRSEERTAAGGRNGTNLASVHALSSHHELLVVLVADRAAEGELRETEGMYQYLMKDAL